MAYKCVNCSTPYEDGSKEVLEGCSKCGRKFFFYIKKEMFDAINNKEEEFFELSPSEKQQIESDVRDISGIEDEESPVFLDFESVKIVKGGKYLLDLSKLFSQEPRIYQLEDGKYIVDFSPLTKFNENNAKS